MADLIKVNTDLLNRCAGELKTAAQGFGSAASILAGLNTGEEWWSKMGRLATLRLEDEGTSAELSDAGTAVRALTGIMRRYDSRLTKVGESTAKTAVMFSETEMQLLSRTRAGSAGKGRDVGAAAVAGAGAAVSAIDDSRSEAEAKKKREEQAKWLKIGAGVLCAVGSIAVVVATGGAALPVIAAGAAAGAITAGVNNAADQYAEKGWDDIDWADAGKDAVIGGIVGGVTSAISIGGSAVANQAVSRVTGQVTPYLTSATQRMAVHVIGGVTSSVAAGTASRAGGEAVRQYLDDGSVDWEQVRDKALDPRSMTVDAVMGGVTGYQQGRRYNRNIVEYEQKNNQILRDEKYRSNNPYSKEYGGVAWEKNAPNGGADASKPIIKDYEIPEGTMLRRTGPESGSYLRNMDDSFESASLPYVQKGSNEHLYKVIKPIPGVTKSTAAPAFDMPGGATQYQMPKDWNIKWLADPKNGYLKRIY